MTISAAVYWTVEGKVLSDAEQRRLAEIESALRADDPSFVQRFETARPDRRRRRTIGAVLAVVAAMTVTVVGLVGGSVAVAVFGVTAIGAAIGIWATRRDA